MKKVLVCVIFFCCICTYSQYLNKEVKAVLEVVKSENIFEITSKAENMSDINQSLTYELKVFKKNDISGNESESNQSGRFVIAPDEVKKMCFSAINSDDENEKIIILLLIRNLDNEIIGKARNVIINGVIESSEHKITLKNKPKDGIRLRGVVLEKVKTKPGRDFYGFFYSQFLSYNFTDSRIVLIEEVFSRGRTTKIHIKVDNIKVYEFFVQPKTDYLNNNANIAVRIIYNYFNKKEKKYIVKY
ncbi:MAG: hypothetical protein HRT69_05315 [Flavobacteriaceae bacterium]|nr:hypothetical protein [Flavobacteriaceae bacterium]